MFILYANKNQLTVRKSEPLTSGSVNVNQAQFQFSPDWEGLTKTAVFKAGTESRSVPLDDSGQCTIPWEVLTTPGQQLTAGVYGTRNGDTVLPTIWANLGKILAGAAPDEDGQYPPTPELWQQELAKKQDKLTGAPGQVVGFDADGNAVAQDAAGGPGTQGPPGPAGKDGLSAYQIAVENGFEGTETEWLASLEGPAGAPGFSPTVAVEPVEGGNRVTITDVDGPKSFDVLNGTDGGGGGGEVYSTEETKVGTWINGKLLYRKVIVSDFEEGIKAEIKTLDTIEGLKEIAMLQGYIRIKQADDMQIAPLPMNGIFLAAYNNDVALISPSNMAANITISSIVEYTKTTD